MNYFTLLPDGVKALILAYLPYPELKVYMADPLFKAPNLAWILHYHLTLSETLHYQMITSGQFQMDKLLETLDQLYWMTEDVGDEIRDANIYKYAWAYCNGFEILTAQMRQQDPDIHEEAIKKINTPIRMGYMRMG